MISTSNKFLSVIIAILLLIIFVQRSCSGNIIDTDTPAPPSVKTEIRYIKKDSIIYRNLIVHKTLKPGKPVPISYVPKKQCDSLKIQYESLVKEHTYRNIHVDSIKIDSIGRVVITDTVEYNKISGRKYDFSYKIPVVTKTITVTAPSKRQVYIGGGISATQLLEINTVNAGLLYKNRKDQIYSVNAGLNFDGKFTYGVGAFWKIKLKK